MAVVRGPLLSMDASGNVGRTVTFSHWKGRNVLRKRVIPANPRSGLQTGVRAGLRVSATKYKTLTATNKANWLALAKTSKITPANAMQRFNQPRVRRNQGPVTDPTNPAGAVEAAPTGVTATGAPKSVNLVWVDSVGATDWCTFIYMSTTTGFTTDVSNLVRIVLKGVQLFTVPKLITGTPYYFVLQGCESGGTMGTKAAQVTATPT